MNQTPQQTDVLASQGRSALVTGASKGIGRAIATDLVAAGFRVAGTYRSGDVPAGVLGVQCDITDPEAVTRAFAEAEAAHGPIEVVVANAGITKDTLLMRMSEDDFATVIDTNLTGTWRVVKTAIRPMMKARHGRIVLISSVVGLLGSAGQVNYAASKSALVGLARSVSREVGSRGITCNVVAPGFIETDMTAVLSAEMVSDYTARIPAARLGATADVAAAVRFLVSDQAGYITGAVIPVDGGLGMGH